MKKEFTGFVRASGVGSWHTGETKDEAAKKAVAQFKRDFKTIFKLPRGFEYKVAVYDTTGVDEWVGDENGLLHVVGGQRDGETIKYSEIVKVVS